jgi:hypothetical protein
MRRSSVFSALLLIACASARSARADTNRTLALSWVEAPGAESCGGASRVAKGVELRLGRRALVSPSQAALSVEARAEHVSDASAWRATLVLRSIDGAIAGTRQIEAAGADCSELREAVALTVALMIDPGAALRPEQAPASAPAKPVIPPPPVPLPRWRIETSFSAAVADGVLPSASAGFIAGVTVVPPRFWAFELLGGAWLGQSISVGNTSVRFSAAFGGAGVCPVRLSGRYETLFQACAGGLLGSLRSTSPAFSAGDASSTIVNLFADAHVSFRAVGPVSLRLGGTVAPALWRSQFLYDTGPGRTQGVFEASAVVATGDLGLAMSFP